ncbi:hypothetical protein ABT095_18550 [Kitasatospora sp. NPDC002227]|uniref:hypothetical protein n=1 Tax=Kitasatospora sp. NPDC002227 TaxID=3154773 RepID=UPI00332AE780
MPAGPSRLVFRLPPELGELPYDLSTLLGAVGFEPVLVPAALTEEAAPSPAGSGLRPPEPTETAIELPQRLLLSPQRRGGWTHATAPVEHDGRVELWHSRLGVRVPAALTRRVRAAGPDPPSPAVGTPCQDPRHDDRDPAPRARGRAHRVRLGAAHGVPARW